MECDRLTRMEGVAILGGTRPPSWRRMSVGCMVAEDEKRCWRQRASALVHRPDSRCPTPEAAAATLICSGNCQQAMLHGLVGYSVRVSPRRHQYLSCVACVQSLGVPFLFFALPSGEYDIPPRRAASSYVMSPPPPLLHAHTHSLFLCGTVTAASSHVMSLPPPLCMHTHSLFLPPSLIPTCLSCGCAMGLPICEPCCRIKMGVAHSCLSRFTVLAPQDTLQRPWLAVADRASCQVSVTL